MKEPLKIKPLLPCTHFSNHRPVRSFVIHVTRLGLPGFWADPTLAVFAGITLRRNQLSNHYLGGNQW